MKIYRSADAAANHFGLNGQGCVVTIGNFDGVHIGHQAMIRAARAQADRLGLPLLVMSFDPHPEAFFAGSRAHARLSSLGERVVMLQQLGVDAACIMPFNARLAGVSHDRFVSEILCRQLKVKCVVIGDDFHYGAGRKGNSATLSEAAGQHGFELVQLHSIVENTQRVSSTRIRHLLQEGNLDDAARLLGRQYQMMGRVTHGDARGRTWGFPTMNLPMRHRRALKGVFAVRVSGLDGRAYEGVANLGKRPTVGGLKTLLETHLFDYDSEAYGKRICVDFYARIREEQKFESFDALKAQIAKDILQAKSYFQTHDV